MTTSNFNVKNTLTVNSVFSANSSGIYFGTTPVLLVNTSYFALGVINASSIGFLANTTLINLGNSSINSTFTASSLIIESNSTVNTTIGATSIGLYTNSSANAILTGTSLSIIANSTGNVQVNNTNIIINTNATTNSILSGASLTFETNSTVNTIVNATSHTFNVNSTVNATLTGNSLASVGNSFFTISTTNAASTPLTVLGVNSPSANIFQVSNGTIQFAVNSSGVAVGNGAGLTLANNVLYANVTEQTITGGAIVTSYNLGITNSSITSITANSGICPLQYLTNNGAFTLTAPSSDGTMTIFITNGAVANTITYSGFSNGASTGDSYVLTSTYKFFLSIIRVNGTSTFRWAACQ